MTVLILLVVDAFSSLAYPMITHTLPVTSNSPIKTLVARQLPTNVHTLLISFDSEVKYNNND